MARRAEEAADRLELEHEFLDNAKGFHWSTVKTMLEQTPDLINVQPCGRWTALHQAAFNGNEEMVSFLLEKGADREATNRQGKCAGQVAKGKEAKALLMLRAPAAGADAEEEAAEEDDNAEEDGNPENVENAAEPLLKKAKTAKAAKKPKKSVYMLNINNAVDKEYEGSSFLELCDAPVSALQGIGARGTEILKKLKVKTVRDLGTWKFYRMSKAMAGLAALEEAEQRETDARSNVNKAVDKTHETKALGDIQKLAPSALQGLAPWVDPELAALGVTTIQKLGNWKFAQWAEWIVTLADFESADFGSL